MIANCGALGIDWQKTSLAEYAEALEAHNAAHSTTSDASGGRSGPVPVSDGLRKFMAAHS